MKQEGLQALSHPLETERSPPPGMRENRTEQNRAGWIIDQFDVNSEGVEVFNAILAGDIEGCHQADSLEI
jgi:hypothetical protein